MTDLSFGGFPTEASNKHAGKKPGRLPRLAVMGVGAAMALTWLSVSARYVDADALKAGFVQEGSHTQRGGKDAVSSAVAADASVRETGPRHAALLDTADLAHAGMTGRQGRTTAESHVFDQPEALSGQAFTLRFETHNTPPGEAQAFHPANSGSSETRLASLQPDAGRFGGDAVAVENAPLRAALAARYNAGGNLTIQAALDPDVFVLPQDVPVPSGRPRAIVAEAQEEEPVQAPVVAAVEPAEPVQSAPAAAPSRVLLAVVESLPSVAALVTSVKPRKPAAEKPAKSTTIVRSKGKTLAYASPDLEDEKKNKGGGLLANLFGGDGGKKSILPKRRSGVAIYDISAAVVHMPNGEKLEAHSGLGHMKDNPKYAHRRMKGPTPPNVYNLRMREKRYHGVEAIRMLPTNHKMMKGRDGILAHTSLVRGTNGSHGCVAFKDYNKFLKAFKRGEVKKIVVVPRMSEAKTYLAML